MKGSAFRQTQEFQRGRNGERVIAAMLMRYGYFVIPSYDYSGEDENAPKMERDGVKLIIPDLDVCMGGKRKWVEVKTKAVPTLYRKTGIWEHGISRRHFEHYWRVECESGCPVSLCIFEEIDRNILIATLSVLASHARFYDGQKMGRAGMVFFPRSLFTPLSLIEFWNTQRPLAV